MTIKPQQQHHLLASRAAAIARLRQEIARLGGDYAHVLDEHIDSRHNDVTGEAWLQGRFSYTLYRRQSRSPDAGVS
jgi:hypothetical protein